MTLYWPSCAGIDQRRREIGDTTRTLHEKDRHILCFVMPVVVPRQRVSTKRTQSSIGGLAIGKPDVVVSKLKTKLLSFTFNIKSSFCKGPSPTFPSWESNWDLEFGPILPIDGLLSVLDGLHAEVHHVAHLAVHQDHLLHLQEVQKHQCRGSS